MFRSIFNKGKLRKSVGSQNSDPNNVIQPLYVSETLQTNIDNLTQLLDNPDDLKIRFLHMGDSSIKIATVFFEGIVDPITTEQSILNNLEMERNLPLNTIELFEYVNSKLIAVND